MQTCHQVFSKSSYHYALGSAQTGSLSIGKTNMFSVFLCMVTTGLMLLSPVPTCYRVICVHVTRKHYKKPLKPFCLRLTSGWRTLISTRTVSCHTRNSKRASRKPSVHISAHVDTKQKICAPIKLEREHNLHHRISPTTINCSLMHIQHTYDKFQ